MDSENYITKMEGPTKAHGKMEKFKDMENYTISLEIQLTKAIGIEVNFMEKVK